MPHPFDCEDFGNLVDDAEKLWALSLDHERTLATARDLGADPPDRLAEAFHRLYAESQEQSRLAGTILQRLAGSVDANSTAGPVILIVDDSLEARESTALLLEESGFRVITAANGLEALIIAHYARPAVVLLDLMMPILDGLQTARLLSESPSTWRMKVIAYSGRADMFSKRLPGTFSAILAKPTTPEQLLSLVQQHAATASA
jgi:CheY-like chemotaxis protein